MKKSKVVSVISLALMFLMLWGCSFVLEKIYGIKTIKEQSDEDILRYGNRYGVPESGSYELDTAYSTYIASLDTAFSNRKKDRLQPLQVHYYNRRGELISYHVNCYAGGFPDLNWTGDSLMNEFPPGQQAPLDTLLPLQKHLKFLNPIGESTSPAAGVLNPADFDYTVIVHWNCFMSRQSKRLIRTVQENRKLAGDIEVNILYANNDNMFVSFKAER